MMTTHGEIDEHLLIKHVDKKEIRTDNYHAIAIATEYCLKGCKGHAHVCNEPDQESFFCQNHIRRDVHVDVLEAPGMTPLLQGME